MHRTSEIGHDHASNTSFVSGLLCGAAIGAAAAMLLTPKTGSQVRETLSATASKLRRRAEQAADNAADAMGDMASRGESAMHEVRRTADHIGDAVGGNRRDTF